MRTSPRSAHVIAVLESEKGDKVYIKKYDEQTWLTVLEG